jgi:Zn-dependent protease/CBS domain-containing protein
MGSQIKLGKIFGIRIGLHYSWFLIALLLIFSLSANFRGNHPDWTPGFIVSLAIATAILFFVSLVLHELSHSLVAKTHGLPVREITLFALGGVSQIQGESTDAKTEFWMAIVGPITSAVIGLICLGVVNLTGGDPSLAWVAVLSWLGYINFGLALFNMVPGYPLDGGRVLRALIWWKTGDVDRSTRSAARAGQAVAVLFIAAGIFQYFGGAGIGGLWIAFIGWFLLQAAGATYAQVGLKQALQDVRVGEVMNHDCVSVDANMSIDDFVEKHLLRTGRRCFMVMDGEQTIGLITPHEVKQVSREEWPYVPLREVMRSLDSIRTVKTDASLASALEVMSRGDVNQLPVMSDGHVDGILSRAEILSYLQNRDEVHA